jgi:hypothetical protein
VDVGGNGVAVGSENPGKLQDAISRATITSVIKERDFMVASFF